VRLNPRVAAKDILGLRNDIQIWGFSPVYLKEMDAVFFKMAVGDGTRSRDYARRTASGKLKRDSGVFLGTGGGEGPLDLRVRINLDDFQKIVNRILAQIHKEEFRRVEENVEKKKTGTHYLLSNVELDAAEDRLRINAEFSKTKISKRCIINPVRWFKGAYVIARQNVSAYADLDIKAFPLEDFRHDIEKEKPGLFLSGELLKLDIAKAGFKIGDPSLFQKIMQKFLGDIDLSRESASGKLKRFLLKRFASYFNASGEDEGSTEVAGLKINKFVKVFTGTGDIFVQLNPRLISPAFDVKLIPNQNWNGMPLGFFVDSEEKKIVFDFKTYGSMASSDKADLLDIARLADLEFKSYLSENNSEKLLKRLKSLELFDKAFYSGDESKLSLFGRIKRQMNLYYAVAELTFAGRSAPDEGLRGKDRRITVTGSEIIYFLSAASGLWKNLSRLLARTDQMRISANVPYIKKFKYFEKLLRETIILPLAEKYEKDHKLTNEMILERGVTDWNRLYYSEAKFAAAAYKRLKTDKLVKKARYDEIKTE